MQEDFEKGGEKRNRQTTAGNCLLYYQKMNEEQRKKEVAKRFSKGLIRIWRKDEENKYQNPSGS